MLGKVWVRLSVAILMVTACAEPKPPLVVQPVATGEAAIAAVGGEPGASVWSVGHVEALPADTELVIVARDPRRLLSLLEYAEVRARYAAAFAPMAAEALEAVGADLTSPDALEAAGIDTSAPMGFAWLNTQAEAGCIFGGLHDVEAFQGAIQRAAGLSRIELEQSRQGETLVLRASGEDEAALLVQPHRFMFVFVDRDQYAPGIIGRLARLPLEDSLSQSPVFRQLTAHRLATGDVTGYVGVEAATAHLFGELRGGRVPLLSDVNAIVFGLGIGREANVAFDAIIDTKEGSLLRKVAVEGPIPHVFRARIDEPAFVVGGRVAHDQIGPLIDELLEIDGRPERDKRALEDLLGMDLHRQVAKSLTGEIGLAVRTDVTDADRWSRERVTISGGLEDDGGKALAEQLKRVVGQSDEPTVEQLGSYLVVTDDAATLASLKGEPSPGRLPKGLTYDEFFAPGALVLLRLDASFVAAELFDLHRTESAMTAPPVPPPPPTPNPRADELARRIAVLDGKIEEAMERGASIEREAGEGASRRAGSTLLRLSRDGDMLRITGVQALQAPSVAHILERVFHDLAESEGRLQKIEAEVQSLSAQRRALELEVEQLAPTPVPR